MTITPYYKCRSCGLIFEGSETYSTSCEGLDIDNLVINHQTKRIHKTLLFPKVSPLPGEMNIPIERFHLCLGFEYDTGDPSFQRIGIADISHIDVEDDVIDEDEEEEDEYYDSSGNQGDAPE